MAERGAIDQAERRLIETLLADNGGSFARTSQHISKLYKDNPEKGIMLSGMLEDLRKEQQAQRIMRGSPLSRAPGAAPGMGKM